MATINQAQIKSVIAEKNELVERINKLKNLVFSEKFESLDYKNRVLLRSQLETMRAYENVLALRCDLYNVDKSLLKELK